MEINKFGIVEKQFEYRGHDCLVMFTHWGVRNGYVSVSLDKDFTDYSYIDCHGGINFSGELSPDFSPKAKCYIGFDCGHCGDDRDFDTAYKYGLIDAELRDKRKQDFPHPMYGVVASLEHVESECKWIVVQLEGESKSTTQPLKGAWA